ncbi:hypothetical protein D018_0659A, partial [Vibrio parahaemolyticus VP2007-007]
MPNIFAT